MNEYTRDRVNLFADNIRALKKAFALHSPIIKRLAAIIYAQEGKAADPEAIRRGYEIIKKNASIFSMFRGNLSLCAAALLSLSGDPQAMFDGTLEVYAMLKDAKFWASDYLAVAALLIASGTGRENYARVVSRAKTIYGGMKARHWFLTGQDDYVYAAMLGMSGVNEDSAAERVEWFYGSLKNRFFDANSVQALAQILVLCGASGEAADRVLSLRETLKAAGVRLDRMYTLPMLGVFAAMPVDGVIIARDLKDAMVAFREQKGVGFLVASRRELLIYAAAITASKYAGELGGGAVTAAVSTGIAGIIIAQQTAMIVALAATSRAAASSHSSS